MITNTTSTFSTPKGKTLILETPGDHWGFMILWMQQVDSDAFERAMEIWQTRLSTITALQP